MAQLVERINITEEPVSLVIEKAKEGLIPIRKPVTRKGKTYTQTFWVKPQDLRTMHVENAAKFLEGMVKAQKYFKDAMDRLDAEGSNDTPLKNAAAAVREQMVASGQKLVKIGELQMEIGEFSRQNPVSGDRLLAAIESRPESEIPKTVRAKIIALYQDVTTSTFGENLKISGETSGTIRTSTAERSHVWDAKTWGTKIKDILSKKVAEVRGIFGFKKIASTPSSGLTEAAKTAKKPEIYVTPTKPEAAQAVGAKTTERKKGLTISPESHKTPMTDEEKKKFGQNTQLKTRKKKPVEEKIVMNPEASAELDRRRGKITKSWSAAARTASAIARQASHRVSQHASLKGHEEAQKAHAEAKKAWSELMHTDPTAKQHWTEHNEAEARHMKSREYMVGHQMKGLYIDIEKTWSPQARAAALLAMKAKAMENINMVKKEQLQHYEKKYSDKTPHKAVEAAERYYKEPNRKNALAARDAAKEAFSASKRIKTDINTHRKTDIETAKDYARAADALSYAAGEANSAHAHYLASKMKTDDTPEHPKTEGMLNLSNPEHKKYVDSMIDRGED